MFIICQLNEYISSAGTLVISFIGLQTQEVAIQPVMKVVLKSDAETLDEVVVTAMGIKRDRKALGYAAQDLKSEELNKSGTTSLASAIQGKRCSGSLCTNNHPWCTFF